MTEAERAKSILHTGNYNCVAVKGETAAASRGRGISPLLAAIESGKFEDRHFADRIAGRAAALLYLEIGIRSLYADVIEERAAKLLKERGITVMYEKSVSMIVNRAGTGPCPMSQAVEGTDSPNEAYEILKRIYDGETAVWTNL